MAGHSGNSGNHGERGTFAWGGLLDVEHSERAYWRGIAFRLAKQFFGWALVYGIIALVAWAILAGWRIP